MARGSRARGSGARTRSRARRPTCCEAAASESPQPIRRSPSPGPTPLACPRDAALSRRSRLPPPPPSSSSPKPTNPGPVPTEARWPRPPRSPARGAPRGLRKGRGGTPSREAKAHAQILGAVPEEAGTFAPGEESTGGGAAPERASRRSQGAGRRCLRRTIIVKHRDGAQGCVPHLVGSCELLKSFEPFALGAVS